MKLIHQSINNRAVVPIPSWPSVSMGLLVIVSAILPPAVSSVMCAYFLLLAALVAFFKKWRPCKTIILCILTYLSIVVIGLLRGVGSDVYVYLKDAWYIVNPCLVLLTGYSMYSAGAKGGLGYRYIIFSALALSILHLSKFLINPELIFLPAVQIRETVGTGYLVVPLAISIIAAARGDVKNKLGMNNLFVIVALIVLCVTSVLFFSRTILLLIAVGVGGAYGFVSRRMIFRGLMGVFFFVGILMVLNNSEILGVYDTKSFVGKTLRFADELKIEEFRDIRSINENWRGYELAMSLRQYVNGDLASIFLGEGFGSSVDLGLFMPLGTGVNGERISIHYAPVLHNGYAYLLLKGGAVAAVIFIMGLWIVYAFAEKSVVYDASVDAIFNARLLQLIVVSILVSTWIISGPFNKQDLFSYIFLMGWVIGSINKYFGVNK